MSQVMVDNQARNTFRIDCRGFSNEEADSLRRLLNLLKSHLKQSWEVVLGDDGADMVLLNLDGRSNGAGEQGTHTVGCAAKPRQVHGAKLHRPFRAYELLAVLTEFGQHARNGKTQADPKEAVEAEWRYRLRSWPLNFATWPRAWWPVLASITRQYRCKREIVIRTGLDAIQVEHCLHKLEENDCLDREVEHREIPRVDPATLGVWKGLASKVGRLLGFAR